MLYQMLLRLLLSAAGLGLAAVWLDGVHVAHISTLFWAALLLGIANTVVRPLLILLTLPATILTLGLFLLVINAAMLGLVSWVLPGFTLDGFWPALGAWFIVAVLQGIGSLLIGKSRFMVKIERLPKDRY
jgi:putative membrane protein